MSMSTLGLGEASSRPAARYVAAPESERPHLWDDDRCARCSMHREWDGAGRKCTGIDRSAATRRGKR